MSRTGDDACPGALQVHRAADGPLARVRLPGGLLSADQLGALAETAERLGDGDLQLTSRANLQLRGLTDPAAAAGAIAAAGLLPSATHERVRNIVASPLSGRSGGLADIRPLVTELDEAIRSDPGLARLPGRFLFGLDDGTGDVAGLSPDAGVRMTGDGAALLLAGADTGRRMDVAEVVGTLVGVARRFVDVRGTAWRVSELDDRGALLDGLATTEASPNPTPTTGTTVAGRPPIGWITQDDGRIALGAAVPLGVLSARQAQFIAAIGAPVVITPWRSLLVCDLDEGVADASLRVLPPLGLVFDGESRWLEVSACVGSPGCERSRADVRTDAARLVHGAEALDGPVHYAGCERACGRPPAGQLLIATDAGYRPVVG